MRDGQPAPAVYKALNAGLAFRQLGRDFARCYGISSIGLRYFNVFGPRQDPDGAYTAIIPKWTDTLFKAEPAYTNGDGDTSRDFCFWANAAQANLLAATAESADARNQVYNVDVGDLTTLNDLFALLHVDLSDHGVNASTQPVHRQISCRYVCHSQADVGKAQRLPGYALTHRLAHGVAQAMPWHKSQK